MFCSTTQSDHIVALYFGSNVAQIVAYTFDRLCHLIFNYDSTNSSISLPSKIKLRNGYDYTCVYMTLVCFKMLRRGLFLWLSRVCGILVLVCCFLSLLYVITCNPHTDDPLVVPRLGAPGSPRGPGVPGVLSGAALGSSSHENYQALLQEREEQQRQHISSLKKQIAELKEALQERVERPKELQEKPGDAATDLNEFLRTQMGRAEISAGVRLPNEYAVIPFESFTLQRVYQLETGLTRHPEEKPARKDRRDEINEVVESAVHTLNSHKHNMGDKFGADKVYSMADFVEGEFGSDELVHRMFDTGIYG